MKPVNPFPETRAASTAPESRLNPELWVEQYGDYLFQYAWGRVRSRARAEDLVQETFLAALRSLSPFQGRSAERSWLTGILKNKILDYYRTADRERTFTDLEFYEDEESERFVSGGLRQGAWIHEMGPRQWSPALVEGPDRAEFWKCFQSCTDKLPPNIARVFVLREVDEMESAAICELLRISPNNLWVMLHRARMALRRCLEDN